MAWATGVPAAILGLDSRARDPARTARCAAQGARAPLLAASGIELYSSQFYTACAIGGTLACGLTHMAVTPLDVVKCNMQANSAKYPSIATGFGTVMREEGMRGLVRGWFPTLVSCDPLVVSIRCAPRLRRATPPPSPFCPSSGTRPRARASSASTSTSRRRTPTWRARR